MKRVNMEFDEDESGNIEELMEYYGLKTLTEMIRYCIKESYNMMEMKK
jgi:hypothetical protein